MALPSSATSPARLRVLTVPAALLLLSSAALLVFLILPSLSPSSTSAAGHLCTCSPPATSHTTTTVTTTTTTASHPPVTTSPADVSWLKAQLAANSLHLADGAAASRGAWHRLRKGINPRTREQQLFDINRYRKHECP
jgi:hypothetical protein